MKFIKDLLFFEFQTTGQDTDKDSIIQLAAVFLDKDNLLEKGNFNCYVRVSYLDSIITEHSKMLGVDFEVLKKSPKIFDCIKQFKGKFGTDLLLATHNVSNLLFLKNAFKKAAIPFEYDTHLLELWTLGYIYTLQYGLRKMPTFNTFIDHFALKQQNPKDALEKVRLEADVFRKLVRAV